MSPYETNFHREKTGNSLHQGEDLTITIGDEPHVVTGKLYIRKFLRKQLIQIEQSGHKGNPSNNSITFEMKGRTNQPMKRGKYRVETKANYYPKRWENDWGDNFEIV